MDINNTHEMDRATNLLALAEQHLDTLNARFSDIRRLCLYCYATTYDSVVGIKHKDTCIITLIRGFLNEH